MGEGNIAFHYRIDESRLINLFHWLINSADHHISIKKRWFFAAKAMISATLPTAEAARAARLRVPHSFSRREAVFSGGRLKQRRPGRMVHFLVEHHTLVKIFFGHTSDI